MEVESTKHLINLEEYWFTKFFDSRKDTIKIGSKRRKPMNLFVTEIDQIKTHINSGNFGICFDNGNVW